MRAYKTVKNTGIAVISDCGEFNEIHPKNKVPVGERLCLQAEKLFYGMDVKAFGPIYKSLEYKNGGIELSFDHAENGFVVKGEAQGFEIAGKDEEFVKADITINGSKIFIKSDAVQLLRGNYLQRNRHTTCTIQNRKIVQERPLNGGVFCMGAAKFLLASSQKLTSRSSNFFCFAEI